MKLNVFFILLILATLNCSKGGEYEIVRSKRTIESIQKSGRIPILLVYGTTYGKERSINSKSYLYDGWLMNNLSLYRADIGFDSRGKIEIEDGDVIEDLTFYNAKYHSLKFSIFYYIINTSLEYSDDKILATGYLIKGSKL